MNNIFTNNIKTIEFLYMDMFPSQKQIAQWDAEFQEYKKKKKDKKKLKVVSS